MSARPEALALVEQALMAVQPYRFGSLPPDWLRSDLATVFPERSDLERFFDALRLAVAERTAFSLSTQVFDQFTSRLAQQQDIEDVVDLVASLVESEQERSEAAAAPSVGEPAPPASSAQGSSAPAHVAAPQMAPAPPRVAASPAPAPSWASAPPQSSPPPPMPVPPVAAPGPRVGSGILGSLFRWRRAAPPKAAAPASNATVVNIFYATDRLETPAPTSGAMYSSTRSLAGKLHYGTCEISIPKTHKTGSLEGPSLLRFEFRPDPERHIVLAKTTTLQEQRFFDAVSSSVSRSARKDAFVFIHGYNVSFEDAARRTGQIAFDLSFTGAPIFYSWPSNGRVADYLKDETNITWSAPHFESFLAMLAERSGAERIHVIAHSMGNRAVCEALRNLSRSPGTQLKLRHLVLAAPDIDAQTFAELAGALQSVSARVTLYESSNDKAIQTSKTLHGNARAGEPLLVLPGLDTIDASAVDTDFLGHSYFSDNWPLLSDIHSLLARDEAPATRFGLTALETSNGRYYSFRP